MNMQRYWAVIRENWIVFLVGAVLTTGLAANYARGLPDVYEATGTFVVRPRLGEGGEVVRAMDTLNRSTEISSTYAFVARSNIVEERAKASLDRSTRGMSTSAKLITGTSVIEISATGPDPVAARDLAEAVGTEAVSYIGELEDAFELAPLDPVEVPRNPVAPNRTMTVLLGLMFGIGVGSLMALVGHLARERKTADVRTATIQPLVGLVSEESFNKRFRQEVTDAARRDQVFSLGLLRVSVATPTHEVVPTNAMLQQVAIVLRDALSEDDVVAYLGEGVFAIMMIDADQPNAEWQLRRWQKQIQSEFSIDGDSIVCRVSYDVGTYGAQGDTSPPALLSGPLSAR